MNTIITFELAKLLKEKGFDTPTIKCYAEERLINKNTGGDLFTGVFRLCTKSKFHKKYYYAPTIAEVVMWLYEKHGIWIYLMQSTARLGFRCFIQRLKILGETDILNDEKYNSPTEAYEAAIKYCLEEII